MITTLVTMLTTMTMAPGCELSARASEHLRFSPGEARPELGLEGGAAAADRRLRPAARE